MKQKMTDNRQIDLSSLSSAFWEELVDDRENFEAEDVLSQDYDARILAIELGIKGGLLPAEAAASVVSKEQIERALEHLNLDDLNSAVEALWRLAGRHLRPLHRKLFGSDPSSSRQQISALRKATLGFEAALENLPPATIAYLQTCHAHLPLQLRTRARIDLGALNLMLTDIGYAAYFAEHALMRGRKQPPKLMRARTLVEAGRIIEQATGETVTNSWSKGDRKHYAFVSEAGRALLTYMKLLEPKASERSLVEDWVALRKADRTTG